MLRLLFCLLSLVTLGVASGCANYQLGTGAQPAFRRLYIEPVANKTMLPQSRALLTTQLREEFLRDGRVSLVNSAGEADAVLTVTISDYRREVAAVRERDTGLARKFNLSLDVNCTLTSKGQKLFENRVITATREAFTDGGQLQSEYQALPLLAESLSKKITHAALDVW